MTLSGIPPVEISARGLTLPDLPDEYLDIILTDGNEIEVEDLNESFPLAVSDVSSEEVLDIKKLTQGDDVKEVYLLELSSEYDAYKPGDTIGIVVRNRKEDVQRLFNHLGISSLAMRKCKVSAKPGRKKNPLRPPFLDKVTTLHKIFTDCLDIQCAPKKSLIRVLSESTKNADEKLELEKLCSKENSELYVKQILDGGGNFLDLLLSYPSCCPPVARLLENLPRLLPRPYSIASSPIVSPRTVRVVFSVIRNENGVEGLCTGMLRKLQRGDRVSLFFRKGNGFNLPEESAPLIFVGPGTGIAPFMGFLEHMKALRTTRNVWLFYGCRKKTNYLFEKELGEYLGCGVLSKVCVAFSRDSETEAKYVQDNIRKYGKELTKLIFDESALIYVCGDAKNMRKDIQNSFVEIFETNKGMTNKEATTCLRKLQKEKKYLEDVWI